MFESNSRIHGLRHEYQISNSPISYRLTVDCEVGRVLVPGRRVAGHAGVVARVPRLQAREGERRRELVDVVDINTEVVVGAQLPPLPLLLPAALEEPLEPEGRKEREEIMERGD